MKKIFIPLFVVVLLLACNTVTIGGNNVVDGSGVVVSETRSVSGFDSIELPGSADVDIKIGDGESVVVETDDNILPLIQTEVRGHTLVIRNKPLTNIRTQNGVQVTVTMKSLESLRIPGSGNVTITGLDGGSVALDISGSGNVIAQGTADSVDINLSGSGNILVGDLQARTVEVRIGGSGNVEVYASEALNASIPGSGSITYRGIPASVDKSISGSGSIDPVP